MRDALAIGLDVTGLAAAFVPNEFGGGLLSLGVDVLRVALAVSGPSGSSRSTRSDPFQEGINRLNKLVQGGQFDEAEQYLNRLPWPWEVKEDIKRQFENLRDRYHAEMTRFAQMNARLNELVHAGDSYGAQAYIESLDLRYDSKRTLLDKIPAAIRQVQESARIRKVLQACEVQVNEYLGRGESKQAIGYVQSLDLPQEIKKGIVAEIQRIVKDAAARQRQAEAEVRRIETEVANRQQWAAKLDSLLRSGQFHKARKYVERLPLPDAAKRRLLATIPDVPPDSFTGPERLAQALSGNLGTLLLVAAVGAVILWVVVK